MFFEHTTMWETCILRNACLEVGDSNFKLYQRNVNFRSCTGLTAATTENNEYHEVAFDTAKSI